MAIHNMRPGRSRRGLRGRGLGTLAVPVVGGQVYGSDVIARTGMRFPARPVGPAYPIKPTNGNPWGGNSPITPAWGVGYQPGSPYLASTPQSYGAPSGGYNLAQLQQLAQTNPGALTPTQIQQLQAAGTLPGTLPPTSGSLISTGSGAIDPATGQTYASELAAAQLASTTVAAPASSVMGVDPVTGATTIFGIDWYYLAAAAVGVYLLTQRRGR